ncbi:MAG: TRAP transporter substrate-binding protein [Methyloligellaceae bacterium]
MRVRNILLRCTSLFAFVLVSAGLSTAVQAQINLRYATWDPPHHEMRKFGVDLWVKSIGEVTKGRVNVRMLTKGLGAPPAYHDFIRDGAIDVAHIIPGYTPGRFVLHQLAEFPFVSDSAKARTVAYWRVYKKHFEKIDEARGMKLMTVWVHGPGLIHNAKRPIDKFDDLQGLKLRVSNDTIGALAKSLNVTPIFMPITKVHNALSKGVIDGTFLTFEGIKNFKLGKLVKFTAVPQGGLYATVFQMYMNKKVWDGIPEADQKLIMSVSGEHAADYIGDAWDLADRNGIKHMKENGVKFQKLPDAVLAEARKRWQPIEAEWIKKAEAKGVDGKAAIAMFKEEIKKIEAQNKWQPPKY